MSLLKQYMRERRGKRGPAEQPKPKPPGPGDHLHALLLKWLGAEMTAGCKCKDWIRKMNAWGPAGCRTHLDKIVDHMVGEAKRRKWKVAAMPGCRTITRQLVLWAIRRAE